MKVGDFRCMIIENIDMIVVKVYNVINKIENKNLKC